MREAAEAGDNVAVNAGVLGVLLLASRLTQGDTARLLAQVFRVLERHIEEDAQRHRRGAVVAGIDCPIRDRLGEAVGCEGVRGSAIDVAWDLVEQKDKRQRSLGVCLPAAEFAARGAMVSCFEAVAQHSVEGGVFLEPGSRSSLAPEAHYLFRAHLAQASALR